MARGEEGLAGFPATELAPAELAPVELAPAEVSGDLGGARFLGDVLTGVRLPFPFPLVRVMVGAGMNEEGGERKKNGFFFFIFFII